MIGYLDLPSGISGDMFLGCLVDAGWPIESLRDTLSRLRLPADSWIVERRDVMKGALRATLVDVRVAEPPPGAAPRPVGEALAAGELSFAPVAPTRPSIAAAHAAGEGHVHRNLSDVAAIIRAADLPEMVKQRAVAVFTRLARAEAKVHGTSLDQVHFHEVGALDAIVDIVGAVAGLHALGIDTLHASSLPLGGGWVDTAHGRLPLPAPATLEIVAGASAPTHPAPGPGELITPTGAALVCELATFSQPRLAIQKVGLGAGQRNLAWPNVARLMLGTAVPQPDENDGDGGGAFVQIETNIDDMNPQFYPAVSEHLFAMGAQDVWLVPIQMKKGRPAVTLCALAPAACEGAIVALLLRETTTLGMRVFPVRKHAAEREVRTVQTAYGPIAIKLKRYGGQLLGAMPEYEDCRRLADGGGVPVKLVYEAALAAAQAAFTIDRALSAPE